jgi:2-polyprenyl-3-methyl-5-hydroxy-6-metoxy-1,4-benzoquinol methylase
MFDFLKKMNNSFNENGAINSRTVRRFFNHTKNLMFDEQAASLEQNAVLEIIKDIPNKRVLDLGCGDGRYSEAIKDYDYYEGVDFSDSFIAIGKERKEKNFVCADIVDYLSDQKFNIILLIGVITYLEDENIKKLNKNIQKMLLDGGVLILRSVTLKKKGYKKIYYDSGRWKNLLRFKPRYQIIRRTKKAELDLFEGLNASVIFDIEGTSYTLYKLFKD